MSQFPAIDQLEADARAAREKLDAAIQNALPHGAIVAVESGPEFVGRFEVQEYPRLSHTRLLIKNLETGVERRVGYQQVKRVD